MKLKSKETILQYK